MCRLTTHFFTLCILLAGSFVTAQAETSLQENSRAIERGEKFLLALIDPELNLLPEFAGHNVVWLYHDNYLAAKVFDRSYPDQAAKIRAAIKSYGVEQSGKIELLFGEAKLPIRRYELRDVAKSGRFTIRSEFTTDAVTRDIASYADLLFFSAIAEPDLTKATKHWQSAIAMWDGSGFKDRVVEKHHQYATYKLALALIAARRFADLDAETKSKLASVRDKLLNMQAASGGWITDYRLDGTPVGLANVETTSLAILALRPAPER